MVLFREMLREREKVPTLKEKTDKLDSPLGFTVLSIPVRKPLYIKKDILNVRTCLHHTVGENMFKVKNCKGLIFRLHKISNLIK